MQINSYAGKVSIGDLPNSCPFCHKSITSNPLNGHKRGRNMEVLMFCPDTDCRAAFIGYYYSQTNNNHYAFEHKISQGTLIGREFTDTIFELSPMFIEIYNQSFNAEQQNLTEICGVGYRKAVEFLIKDYSISL